VVREGVPSLPPVLEVSYAAKRRPLGSAKITVRELEGGGLEQRIEHAPLLGVTREMLFWWMHHIGDQVEVEGQRVLAYRLWHPFDHVHWSCDGEVAPGCRFHIVEAFQRERRYLVDSMFDVPELTAFGFRIVTTFFGVVRLSIREEWSDVPGGVQWTNTMQVVPRAGVLSPLVRVGRAVKGKMLTAWLEHNVEEVGFVPEFLPALYEARA
jgi:hypothetical protein